MQAAYLTYSPIELASDDAFIQWVRNGRPVSSPWKTWLEANPEKQSDVLEACDLVNAIQFKPAEVLNAKTDAIWDRINTTIANETLEREAKVVTLPRRNIFKIMAYAAAACLAALLVFQVILDDSGAIYTDRGATLAHTLPDASKVKLNADSKIKYAEDKWQEERSLTLEGEAFFEVEKGQKFTIHTNHGSVTVLGTSFNVYSREDGFSVHCTTGRVEVKSNNDTQILTPDTKASLSSNAKLIKENLAKGTKVDWLDKIYRFDGIPLSVVFAAVGRQFDVNITMDAGIAERLYTGSFEAVDLQKALNVICFPMELSPIIQNKNIRIQSDEGS